MNTLVVPLHLVLVLSTAIIITARPNISNIQSYERIRKYRYSVEEGSTSETSQEPLLSSATYKTTTTTLLSSTSTQGNDYHKQQLYKYSSSSSRINHISYDDFIHLTSQDGAHNDDNEQHHLPKYIHDESSTSTQSHISDNHTHVRNKLHRTFLRIPTTISATKVILESEEFNEDHLYESYIYS